jgi:hypothetical protein
MDQSLAGLAPEFVDEILSQVQEFPRKLSEVIIETYACIDTTCSFLSKLTENTALSEVYKFCFYYKILKPAWEVDKHLAKCGEVKLLHKEMKEIVKGCKVASLMSGESVEKMVSGNGLNKIFSQILAEVSTDESRSPERSVDSEVEEFQSRLENCEKLSRREKPLVSQEWINTIRKQLGKHKA